MSETDSREKPGMAAGQIEDVADRQAEDAYGAVVLDVGDKENAGQTGYKLAKDGHVCSHSIPCAIRFANMTVLSDCTGSTTKRGPR